MVRHQHVVVQIFWGSFGHFYALIEFSMHFMWILQIWTTCTCSSAYKLVENQIFVLGCLLRSNARNGNEFQTPGHRWLPRTFFKATRGNGYRFVPKGGTLPTETIRLVVKSSGLLEAYHQNCPKWDKKFTMACWCRTMIACQVSWISNELWIY